jgi:hypothetical protein
MNDMSETTYINYQFIFKDGREEYFPITLRLSDLSLLSQSPPTQPSWTELTFNQCENCPLSADKHPYCPLAGSLAEIIPKFYDKKSFETVFLRVSTPERIYEKVTPLQTGLGSLLGIFMVTTGCPHMQPLRPMVRFHLPCATVEETLFRAASTYLLGQYFRRKKGKEADWDLAGLLAVYQEIQTVNMGITDRLRSISEEDANTNAIVLLDVFAKALPSSIFVELRELEYIFQHSVSPAISE